MMTRDHWACTWTCERCWAECHSSERPRCRFCKCFMVKKDDPDDEVPAVDQLVDILKERA